MEEENPNPSAEDKISLDPRLVRAEERVRELELKLGEELTQPGGSENR